MGLAPVGCGCGSGFTPMGAPALDPGWQRARMQVSICTPGSPLGVRLQPMYYNFGSRNPSKNPRTLDGRRPVKTRGHPKPVRCGCGCSFPPTGAGAGFTHQHFGAGRVFGQPAPNPPRCHPYIYVLKVFDLQRDTSSGEEFTQTVLNPDEGGAEHNDPME
jgi:hypothetical protein